MSIYNDDDEVRELLGLHFANPNRQKSMQFSFDKMYINKNLRFVPTWNWWAFFFPCGYFLYRKMYTCFAVMLLFSLLINAFFYNIWLLYIILRVGAAISAKYFYFKKFIKDLKTGGYNCMPSSSNYYDLRDNIKKLGGYHNWVIWLMVVVSVFNLIAFIYVLRGQLLYVQPF